ncbi:MAG: ATP-binding protein [Xenococcaceae cyanobacterium]
MFTSQASILRRTLPGRTFEQLCCLWQQMAEIAGGEAVFVGEEALLPEKSVSEDNSGRECFRVLVSPEFSALLLGKPSAADSFYQVSLTFDSQAIADFLTQLSEQLQHNPTLGDRLQKASLTQLHNDANLQSQFSLQLLEILAPENQSTSPPAVAYPRFYSYQSPEEVLRDRLEQERILNQVTLQINQNLDLLVIVKMTIEQVQRLLQVDRLVIYQLNIDTQSGETGSKQRRLMDAVTYEALASEEIPSILHFQDETCFAGIPECRDKYRRGFCLAVNDVETKSKLSPCLRLLMQRLQVRAKIVTPIIVQGKLWGFLIAHQCFAPRQWKNSEIKFLLRIAEYLAIAIYQAKSYEQLREQKNILEQQVNQRANELQDALLAAQAAHQSKREFISNISHELRTPLTCVIGLSGTLLHWFKRTSPLPFDKQQKYLQTIQESGKQLLELINDILDFSQVEAGKSLLNISEFSLRHLSRIILHSLQEKANRKQINLELDFRVELESDRFWADRGRVQQILFHLLSNAIKFTPAGGRVILRVWREDNQAVFQVEDTGIGISEHQFPLLFEKFQQLEKSRQRTYGGAGLGLALTKQLVELHRGTIEVESILGKGSLFTVWLPSQPNLKSKANPSETVASQLSSGGGTIVLVEKDEEVATLICKLLTAADYQVVWLIDSSTAIKKIELLQPTAVILDQKLPDAYNISQTLKKLKTTKYIKVLILSNQVTSTDWQYLSQNGVDDYLLKPVQPTLLLEKVSTLTND